MKTILTVFVLTLFVNCSKGVFKQNSSGVLIQGSGINTYGTKTTIIDGYRGMIWIIDTIPMDSVLGPKGPK